MALMLVVEFMVLSFLEALGSDETMADFEFLMVFISLARPFDFIKATDRAEGGWALFLV